MNLLEDLFTTYYDTRKGTRSYMSQLHFEMNLEENLRLASCLNNSFIFHLFTSVCLSKTVIRAARKKRTLFGIKRLEKHIRSCTSNYSQEVYILTLEIQGYFMSINRPTLYGTLLKNLKLFADADVKTKDGNYFKDPPELDLVDYLLLVIVFHNLIEGCLRKGSIINRERLPASKSLFHSDPKCGLLIGNLTSRLFSNVYTNSFDHFVKQQLKLKFYGRYMDDIYLIDRSKKTLLEFIPLICAYFYTLRIRLHSNKIKLQSYRKEVAFLRAVVKPYRRYIHNRAKRKFIQVLYHWNRLLSRYTEEAEVHKAILFRMRSSINSYLGMMRYYRSLKLKKKIVYKKNDDIQIQLFYWPCGKI